MLRIIKQILILNANLEIEWLNIKGRMDSGDDPSQFSDFLSGKFNIQKDLEICLTTEINSPEHVRNWHKLIWEVFKAKATFLEIMGKFISFSKMRNHISKIPKSCINEGANTQEIKEEISLYFENISAAWKWE